MLVKYDNDVVAVDLHNDGTGFIYYPTGAVAVCVSQATDYQNSYYCFDKGGDGGVLLGLDERGVGFATASKRKSADGDGTATVFTTKGGIVTNSAGKIVYDWKWDRTSMEAGTEPADTVIIRMNEYITFRYKDRKNISLEFQCENVRHTIDMGVKVRRSTCYLDNAKREPGGRLVPQMDRITLKDRQNDFGITMRAQKNKLHPKSENLSSMVKSIVQNMEVSFADIDKKLLCTPFLDGSWKTLSLENTIREIPRIPISGMETGVFSGYGSALYVPPEDFNMTKTLPAYLSTSKGTVKNELEIRNTLMEMNPPLKRTAMLRAASGRYSSMLVVNKNAVTAANPTGMVVPLGIPLEKVSWSAMKEELVTQAGVKGPLQVALVMRAGDPVCCAYQRITELVNRDVLQGVNPTSAAAAALDRTNANKPVDSVSAQTSGFKMLRLEVSEEPDVMTDLGIKSLPTFVFFSHGNIAYAGPLGGRKVKSKTESIKPQILIIEPNPSDQIKSEKTLRKLGCDTFLCLSAAEAIDRVSRMCLGRGDGMDSATVVFDIVLVSENVQTSDVITLAKRLEDFTKIQRTIICVMVSVLGTKGYEQLHAVPWEHATTERDLNCIVAAPLSNITTWAMQKPIKANAVELILSRRIVPHQEETLGLTEKALYQKMVSVQNELVTSGPRRTQPMIFASNNKMDKSSTLGVGASNSVGIGMGTSTMAGTPYIGICMANEDTKMRGRSLVNTLGKTFTPEI